MTQKKEVEKGADEPAVMRDEAPFQILTEEEFQNLRIRKRGNGKYDKAIEAALNGNKVKVECETGGSARGLVHKIKTRAEYQGKITATIVQGRWVVIYPVP